jgi:hypothetical protein
MVRSRGRMLDWSLHQWAQRPIGPLTRVRIGDAQPVRRLVAPVAHHYKREWGPRAQLTRFVAGTVNPTLLTLADREGGAEATGCSTDAATGPRRRRPCLHRASLPSAEHHRQNQRCEHGLEVWFPQLIPLNLLLVDPANLSASCSRSGLVFVVTTRSKSPALYFVKIN